MTEEEDLGREVINTIDNWFETYDWDEAFERMLRKYE